MSWLNFLPAMIDGVKSLVGRDDFSRNKDLQTANNEWSYKIHEENLAAQKESLQNSVSWRMQDAGRAGVHPLYALGMQPMQTSPTGAFISNNVMRDTSSQGQNISRAIEAMQTRSERAAASVVSSDQMQMNKLSLERATLENDLIRSQLARNSMAQIGPAAPQVGSIPSPRSQPRPQTPVISSEHDPARGAGHIVDYDYARSPSGGLVRSRSRDQAERLEEDWVGGILWDLRNRLAPNINPTANPPSLREYPLPAGQVWRWDAGRQEYRPAWFREHHGAGRGRDYHWVR